MRFSTVVLASAAAVSAQTVHNVIVGGNGTLTYNPPSLTGVAVGDTVAFTFTSKAHTVTQSSFGNPCANLSTDPTQFLDSGIFPVAAGATQLPQWSFTLTNATAPLWFYCRQVGHCAKGMVFAINPTATKSYNAFQLAANATKPTTDTNGLTPNPATPGGAGTAGTTTTGTTTNGGSAGGASGSGSSSGAPAGGSGTTTGTGTAAGTSPTSGARALGASAAGLLTVAGVMSMLL